MPLDKAAFESLRLDQGSEPQRYQDSPARRIATVSSKVTGRVSEVLIEEGARVKQGQVLATLDPATARAEYNLTNQSLEASRRSLREIQVRLAYLLSPCAGETRPLRSRQSHVALWHTSRPIAGE
jgi:multidrug efflux pump subunit AcrA (membrane-fusion protein)